jgi:Gly-Xaa carboxypeptidase
MVEKKKETQGSKLSWFTIIALASAALLGGYKFYSTPEVPAVFEEPLESLAEGLCPIIESIKPLDYQKNDATVDHIINNPQFRVKAAARLTGAVKIPTVTHDEIGDLDKDPEDWKIFYKMHDYLKETFPLVHKHLKVETVNKYSLVFTWEGEDESLKPLLLTAHQDVVPVAEKTRDDWKHEPFEGHFDGEKLWGRGAADDKNMMIAILSAIETLLEEGYSTKRTVVVAFGHDEEIGGARGAAFIAKFLEERYGKDSFYALIDEGTGLSMIGGRIFAIPSVGEKGATTLYISLTTPGGHSSVPPKHTSIGLVSKVITLIEDNPFPAELTTKSPALGMLQCIARHSEKLPESLRRNIFKAAYDKIANAKVLAFMATKPLYDTFVRTTQAIDVINGGVKSNALPEFVSFVINTRINAGSSVQDVIDKIVGNIRGVAEEHNFGIYLGDEEILPKTKAGYFKIEWDRKLEPAPISPMDDETWDIFAGSVKHIVDDYAYPELPPSVVTGNLLMGNTDTNRYWNLTNHIYRFEMTTYTMREGIHSLNEYVVFNDHLYEIAFIYEYIKNINDFAKTK